MLNDNWLQVFLIEHLNVKPFEELQTGVGSPSVGISIEKQRAYVNNNEIPPDLMEDLRTNLTNLGLHPKEVNGVNETNHMATPGSGM